MINSLHRALASLTALALIVGASAVYYGHAQAEKYGTEWLSRSQANSAQEKRCMDAVRQLSTASACLQAAVDGIHANADLRRKQGEGDNTKAFGFLCVILGFLVWPVALVARWAAYGRQYIPSDRAIFEAIYAIYLPEYLKATPEQTSRRVFYPIDLVAVAKRLHCNEHILFGRFYSDLRQRFNADRREGFSHAIFEPKAGPDRHCINFPYMVAILSGMRDEAQRQWVTWGLSLFALAVSAFSLLVNLNK